MAWNDRLRKSILLTSPEGNEFEALWRGNNRSNEKQIGLFKIPGVRGVRVQDLEVQAYSYPLTLYFDGPDNDIESERFSKALEETGPWSIVHPVKGTKSLQLLNWSEQVQPVESGNLTVFNTEWLEPLQENNVITLTELRSIISNQSILVSDVAATQLNNNIRQDAAAEVAAVRSSVNDSIMAVDIYLKPIYEQNSDINSEIINIKRGITDTLAVLPLDIISLASQLQNLIILPSMAITDITQRMNGYTSALNELFAHGPLNYNTEDINTVSIQEASETAMLQAMAFILSTGILSTRNEAINYMDILSSNFRAVIDNLDSSQELFEDRPIDLQYYSQSESFNETYLMIAQTLTYLLRTSFDIAIEKRFILEIGKSTIRITVEQYGSLGEDDSNLQLFIDSNELIGNELLYLPAGREVVIYV